MLLCFANAELAGLVQDPCLLAESVIFAVALAALGVAGVVAQLLPCCLLVPARIGTLGNMRRSTRVFRSALAALGIGTWLILATCRFWLCGATWRFFAT